MKPLVSIITPTFGREPFLAHTLRWVLAQTLADLEWLVLDDSPAPSATLAGHPDPRVRYEHVAQRLTIGEKRNRLAERARGDIIAHFDDDDYYAPNFLELMVGSLEAERADFVNLSSWYLYDARHRLFGFWDLRQTTGLHYLCYADGLRLAQFNAENNGHLANNYLGYGFSYVYRKALWAATPYDALDLGEDTAFVTAAARRFRIMSLGDQSGMVLHVLHRNSTSSCFPQYHLPPFLLPLLFAPCAAYVAALTAG